MEYILCFAVSTALIAIAQKRKKKLEFILCSALALLIPCLMAGLRAEYVGTDVRHYVKPMTEAAIKADSFGAYINSTWMSTIGELRVGNHEYGFITLVYAVAKLSANLGVVLFVIEAAILVPVYVALARSSKNIPVWLGMLTFYLLFYNGTLNLMRQFMAMALLLLAFQMLRERKIILTALFSALAVLFHYSSALVIPIYAVYGILYALRNVQIKPKLHNNKQMVVSGQTVACVLITACALFFVYNAQLIIELLSALGVDRFSGYLRGEKASLVAREIMLRLPLTVLFVWHWKRLKEHTPDGAFFLTMLLLDVVASQLTSINPYAYRIGLYFALYTVYGLPTLYASLKTPTQKGVTTVIAIGYLICYWAYLHTVLYLHRTYPYEIER